MYFNNWIFRSFPYLNKIIIKQFFSSTESSTSIVYWDENVLEQTVKLNVFSFCLEPLRWILKLSTSPYCVTPLVFSSAIKRTFLAITFGNAIWILKALDTVFAGGFRMSNESLNSIALCRIYYYLFFFIMIKCRFPGFTNRVIRILQFNTTQLA